MSDENELISVIVPVYKVEKYIDKCVNSILEQTYKNLEVILVDDGSPDNCGAICDGFAEKDSRIKVLHKQNGGLSDARNTGIKTANGSYITFVDSDDWIDEEYIEKLYKLLILHNADISVCHYYMVQNEETTENNNDKTITVYNNTEAVYQYFGKNYIWMVITWGKLYKKSLFDDILFPVGRVHEDEFTTHKLIYKSKKTVLTMDKLYYYRKREGSITSRGFVLKNKIDAFEAFEQRAEFFRSINLPSLCTKTYELLFFNYLYIIKSISRENYSAQITLYNKLKTIKAGIRKNKHRLKFRILYESYCLFPRLIHKLLYLFAKKG